MSMKVAFWSEFPKTVDWSTVKRIFRKHKLYAEIYVACRTRREYNDWKRKISSREITVGAWPVLSKKEGYWFSGLCTKKSIDKLNQFAGLKVKIDLEPPFNSWEYSDLKFVLYNLSLIFKRGGNNEYLRGTIDLLSKDSELLINEFPVKRKFLERSGVFYPLGKKNITKNIMLYSTIPNSFLRPATKYYLRNFAKKFVEKNGTKDISFSIGLIGPGILKKENSYRHISEFKRDIEFIKSLGVQMVAIYSIDAIINKRVDAEKWIRVIKGI